MYIKKLHQYLLLLFLLLSIKIIKSKSIYNPKDDNEDDTTDNYFNVYKKTNLTMNDVLKFKAIQCKSETDNSCPEYANGCQYYINTMKFDNNSVSDNYYYCKINLICHLNSGCYFFNTDNTYTLHDLYEKGIQYRNKDNLDKTFIMHSCNKYQYDKGLCFTPSCEKNSDCFSNNCIGGTCMINYLTPAYICSLRDDIYKEIVSCRLNLQEKCKSNEDCHSNTCYNNICLDTEEKLKEMEEEKVNSKGKGKSTEEVTKHRNFTEFTITIILAFISFIFVCIIGITISYMLLCNSKRIRIPSRRMKLTSESETIYILNENNEVIKTKLKMLDSVHSSTSSSTKHRDKKRILTML